MKKLILGENAMYSTDPRETGLNNNLIVIGSPGCGKTTSVAEPCLLEQIDSIASDPSSMVITLAKRKLYNKYAAALKKAGYKVLDLNIADPSKADCSFDFMKNIHSEKDALRIAALIVKANPQKATASHVDPFWDDSAISLLTGLFCYCLENVSDPNMADVISLFKRINVRETGYGLSELFEENVDEDSFAMRCWTTFTANPERTAGCIYSTLSVTLDNLFPPEMLEMSKNNSIDVEKLASEPTILFISFSSLESGQAVSSTLIWSEIMRQLFKTANLSPTGRLPLDITFIADDFGVCPINGFPEYLAVVREVGIGAIMLIQSESQLESAYSVPQAKTILNCVDTMVFMGTQDLDTARSWGQRVDKPFSEILCMPVGDVYICRRGSKTIHTKRYDIEHDKRYKAVTRKYENNSKETVRK